LEVARVAKIKRPCGANLEETKMSFYADEDDDQQSTGKGLRAQLEAALAADKARLKEIETLKKSNEELQKKLLSTSLRDALADAKIDAKYARFAERDGVEATPDGVKKWIEENREVYSFLSRPPEGQAAEVANVEPEKRDVVDPQLVDAVTRARGIESSGTLSSSGDITAKLDGVGGQKFGSYAELTAALAAAGVPFGDPDTAA
jgi:hypothetical protein